MNKIGLFLITGATGKTDAHTVRLLRERGLYVRAFVHTLDDRARRLAERGADVVHGDLLDFHAVSSAMTAVVGLLQHDYTWLGAQAYSYTAVPDRKRATAPNAAWGGAA